MENTDGTVCEFSIVMPCLNESETLESCIGKAQQSLKDLRIAGEVIVADNGSTDGSQEIACRMGAVLVHVSTKGYGAALMGGIAAARGKFIIMGDADDSYDFSRLDPFVEKLREGYDLVMGNRFKGGIRKKAMPPLHRYLGNPVLTAVGRLFFRCPSSDFHCGLRGFRKEAAIKMNLRTTGMEFASEMVVKATLHKMKITEVPTILSPDGRSRPPHLRSWHDGWRHLRFLLLHSPRWLFLYPGLLLMFIGIAAGLWLLPGPRNIGSFTFDVHALIFPALAMLIGLQSVIFAVFAKIFAIAEGLLPEDSLLTRLSRCLTLETGLIAGGLLVAGGLALSFYAVHLRRLPSLGSMDVSSIWRIALPAFTMLAAGCQIVLSGFFLGVLKLKR